MATIKIEPPRPNYMVYYVDRNGVLRHRSLGIPHSPEGATQAERKQQKEVNKQIALGTANDLELAENGRSTPQYIKALFNGAMERAMGVYDQNGKRGVSVKGYLKGWLLVQSHLHEARRIYQSIINTFCASLGRGQDEPLFTLERRHIQEFKDNQKDAGLAASTINGKLTMLEKAFDDAVMRGHMLGNIIYDEDYLEEKRLLRKPFTSKQLLILHERWTHLGNTKDGDEGARAREWLTASKFGALQGMRLGDATSQIRANVDFEEEGHGFITWTPEKTEHLGRVVSLPLHSVMRRHLLQFQDASPTTKLTPLLANICRQDLCKKFKEELLAADIDPEDHELKARVYPAVSFHSHKRFYIDSMEKALVPLEIRKYLGIHSSDESHNRYLSPWTRKDAEAWRSSIEKVRIEDSVSSVN
jgi:hypothetical protein